MRKLCPLILGACLLFNCFVGAPAMAMGSMPQAQAVPARSAEVTKQVATASGKNVVLDPNITMTVRFDQKDRLRMSTTTPTYVTIENKGEAFEGEIRLRALMNPYDPNSAAYDYVQTVEVPAQSQETFTVPFNTTSSNSSITVYLYVNGEKRAQVLKKPYVNEHALVGLVSKREADLNYWKKSTSMINVYSYNVSFEYVDLTPDSIPRESYYLDGFSILVMHHTEWSELDEVQQNTLTDWVYDGGLLVVDGDVANTSAISSLKPIIELKVDGRDETITQEDIEQALYKKSSQVNDSVVAGRLNNGGFPMMTPTLMPATPMPMATAPATQSSTVATPTSKTPITLGKISPAGTNIMMVGDVPVVQSYSVGTGSVLITSFDLASSFAAEIGNSFIKNIIFPEFMLLNNSNYSYMNWPQLINVTENIEWNQLPSAKIILIIGILFILCVGPITYFILKKLDKRDWIWGIAPLLAIICAGLFIVYGYQHHGSEPISSTVTIFNNMGNGHYKRESFIDIGVPKTDSYKIEFDIDGIPSNNMNNYIDGGYDPYMDQPEKNPDLVTNIYEIGNSPRSFIAFPKIPQWTMEPMRITDNIQLGGGIDCQVYTGAEGKLYYEVTNKTGYDLEDISIWALAKVVRVGFLADKDTKTGEFPNHIAGMDTGLFIDDMYGLYDVEGNYRELNEQKRQEDQEKKSILYSMSDRLYSNTYQSTNQSSALVFGWNKSLDSIDAFVNGQEAKNVKNISVFLDQVDVEFIRDGYLSIPDGYLSGMLIDENGVMNSAMDALSSDVYLGENGSQIVQFDIPEGTRFDFTELTFSATEIGKQIKTEIYNVQKSQWDAYMMGRTIKDDQIAQYIDGRTGSVRLRFVLETDQTADALNDENMDIDSAMQTFDQMSYVQGLSIRVSGKEKANAGN